MDELLEELNNEAAWAAGVVLSTPKIETLIEGVAALRAEHAALTEENGRLRGALDCKTKSAQHFVSETFRLRDELREMTIKASAWERYGEMMDGMLDRRASRPEPAALTAVTLSGAQEQDGDEEVRYAETHLIVTAERMYAAQGTRAEVEEAVGELHDAKRRRNLTRATPALDTKEE